MNMNYKKIVIGLTAMALAISATACGRVDKILKKVDEKQYDEALDIYDAKDLSDKDTDKLIEEMETRINAAVDAYAANEIDYDQLEELLDFANETDLSEMTDLVTQVSVDIYELKTSKDYFAEGKQYLEDESYASAYSCFNSVIERDGYYAEAQTLKEEVGNKYCESVQAKIDEYMKDKDYDDAIYYVQQAKSGAYFSDELTERIGDMEESTRKSVIIAKAQELVDEEDIVGALTAVKEAKENYKFKDTKELDGFVSQISKEYVDTVLQTVKNARDEENYILALKILNDAKEIVDDDAFDKEIKEIEAIKPTYLYDLKCSTSSNFETIDSGDAPTDSVGNTYAIGNLFGLTAEGGNWSDKEASAEYNLAYRYGAMSGVISTNDTSDNDAKAIFRIEGDGEVLFAQELSRTTTPVPFAIDMSKYNWLKITLTEGSGGTLNALLSDVKFGKPNEAAPTTEAASEGETTAEGETTTAAEGETTAAEGETTAAEGETTAAEGETTAAESETTVAEETTKES